MLQEALNRGQSVDDLISSPRITAALVLAASAETSWVFPTEHYYYFEIRANRRSIAGNLRLTDVAQGKLHCGVYDRDDLSNVGYALLSEDDGLRFSTLREHGREIHTIIDLHTGAERRFVVPLPQFGIKPPLIAGEQALAEVVDESGFQFWLVYDHASCQFGYMLFAAPIDQVEELDEVTGVLVFEPSGFHIWSDPLGRRWLSAIRRSDTRRNTFYDGPFDQVPPDLELRPLLQAAYPGIEEHGQDQLDLHGNWVNQRGVRVAISPYIEVGDGIQSWQARAAGMRWWARFADARGLGNLGEGTEEVELRSVPFAPVVDWQGVLQRSQSWPLSHSITMTLQEEARAGGVAPVPE